MRRLLLAGCALLLTTACQETVEPLTLAVTIQPSQTTVAPGQPVTFTVDAQGSRITGIVARYGDGSADSINSGQVRTTRVAFQHSYAAAGVYEVDVTVLDAEQGAVVATVSITVQ
jgi:PKD repeat protein